jgi:glutaconate CoA-transferase, subunit B
VPRQNARCLVPRVDVRSTADDDRRTRLLTNLGVFSIGVGGAILEALASHVSLDHVRARTGFAFRVAEPIAQLADPSTDVLSAIRQLDPDNLRAELVGQLN